MGDKLKKLLEKRWFAYTTGACIAVVLYWLLANLFFIPIIWEYISPVIWGIFIAYLINPLVSYLEKRIFSKIKKEDIKHSIAVILSLIIVILLITLLFIAVIPTLGSSVTGLINNMDTYGDNLRTYIANISKIARRMHIDVSGFTSSAEEFVMVIVNSVSENSEAILQSFFDVGISIVNIAIGVVLAVYFLFDKKKLLGGINKIRSLILSREAYSRNNIFWKKCNTILTRFFMFDILEGFIIGLINMVFMFIFNMPYVALISVIIGITNLIPTLGPIIGVSISAILLVLVNPISALLFIIFSIALQTFDASILKPHLFGDSFGVPSVWIFIAIVVGGKMSGIAGVVFAVPIVAIVTYALTEMIIPALEKRAGKNSDSAED